MPTEALAGAGALVTSDHVLVKSWFLISSRGAPHAAKRFWSAIRAGLADVECVTPGDLERARTRGEAFEDQDFSIVARTSSR